MKRILYFETQIKLPRHMALYPRRLCPLFILLYTDVDKRNECRNRNITSALERKCGGAGKDP
jgi:hypothetical protein